MELPIPSNFPMPAFSADGRYLAIREGLVVDVRSASVVWQPKLKPYSKGMAFSPDGKWLACGLHNGEMRFYTDDFRLHHVHQTDARLVECPQFSPDGSLFATSGLENSINLFSTATGKRAANFKKCSAFQTWIRFSADGQRVVSVGLDGVVRLWDVTSGQEVLAIPFDAHRVWPTVEIAPSGRRIAITCGQKVTVIEAADPRNLESLTVAELRDAYCDNIAEDKYE